MRARLADPCTTRPETEQRGNGSGHQHPGSHLGTQAAGSGHGGGGASPPGANPRVLMRGEAGPGLLGSRWVLNLAGFKTGRIGRWVRTETSRKPAGLQGRSIEIGRPKCPDPDAINRSCALKGIEAPQRRTFVSKNTKLDAQKGKNFLSEPFSPKCLEA